MQEAAHGCPETPCPQGAAVASMLHPTKGTTTLNPAHAKLLKLAAALLCGLLAQATEVITNATQSPVRVQAIHAKVEQGTLKVTVEPPPGEAWRVREAWAPVAAGGGVGSPRTLFTGLYERNTEFKNLVFTIPPGGRITFSTNQPEGVSTGKFQFAMELLEDPKPTGGQAGGEFLPIGELLTFHSLSVDGVIFEGVLHQVDRHELEALASSLSVLPLRFLLDAPNASSRDFQLRRLPLRESCCVIL